MYNMQPKRQTNGQIICRIDAHCSDKSSQKKSDLNSSREIHVYNFIHLCLFCSLTDRSTYQRTKYYFSFPQFLLLQTDGHL